MPKNNPAGYLPKRGKGGSDEIADSEKTRGYRRRQAELEEIEDAGGSMNAATSRSVKRARGALERQAQIIRLRRRQK